MSGSKTKELEQLHKDRSVWHVVKEGETLFSIAHDYGMPHWQSIWNHKRNDQLKVRRAEESAGNLRLLKGDVVFIPRLNPFTIGNRKPGNTTASKYSPTRRCVPYQRQPRQSWPDAALARHMTRWKRGTWGVLTAL